MWNRRGTPTQNALVQRFLDASDFPDEVMAPSLLAEGKTAIDVEFAALSQRGARAAGDGHDHGDAEHEQEHAEGVHSIVREVDGRRRVLGLFYLPPFTKVVIDAAIAEQNPTLAVEVLAAEAAHAWDYHWLLPQGMRRGIWNIVHGIAGTDGGPIPESGDVDHDHSYFDGAGGYSTWVGETIMELLSRAFCPGIPVTIQLAHPVTPEMVARARELVLGPLAPQPDPAQMVYRGRSRIYHDHHRSIRPVEWYPDAAAAEAAGLRPCGPCRPGGRSRFLDSDPDGDDEQGDADHDVPAELVELFEVLEWEAAVAAQAAPAAEPEARAAESFIVSRGEWGARAPRSVTALHNPPGVTFHYVGPRYGPFSHASCASKVRAIQAFHMDSRGWSDGAYNMVACPHGYAFVLRGRDVRSAANGTNAGNSGSHAICALLGDGDTITDGLLLALHRARDYLMGGGTGPRAWGHRDWKATGCPGNPLYAWFRAGMRRPGSTDPTPTPSPSPTPPKEDPVQLITSDTIKPGETGVFAVAPVQVNAYGPAHVSVCADFVPAGSTVRLAVADGDGKHQVVEALPLRSGRTYGFEIAAGASKAGSLHNNSKVPVVVLVEHFLR